MGYLEGMSHEICVSEDTDEILEILQTYLGVENKEKLQALNCVQIFHEGDGTHFFLWGTFDDALPPTSPGLSLWRGAVNCFDDIIVDCIQEFVFAKQPCVLFGVPVVWPYGEDITFYANLAEYFVMQFEEETVEDEEDPFVDFIKGLPVQEEKTEYLEDLETRFKAMIGR